MTEEHIERAARNRLQRAQRAIAACEAYWGSLIDKQLERVLHDERFYVLVDATPSKKGSLRCDLCFSTFGGIQRVQKWKIVFWVKFAASDLLIVESKQKMKKWLTKKRLLPLKRNIVWRPDQIVENSQDEELESVFEAGKVSRIQLEMVLGCQANAIKVDVQMNEAEREALVKELQKNVDFGNKNIQRLWGISCHDGVCSVLLEDLPGGPLSRMISDIDRKKFSTLVRRLFSALLFLEQMDVVHKKLSIDVCFVTPEGQIKLALFCLSNGLLTNNLDKMDVDRCRWIPWECVGSEGKEYSQKSVVWSYGTVIWSMYHGGALPYENREPEQITSAGFRKEYELPYEEILFPEDIQELVGNCWQDEENRPSFFCLKEIISKL